MTLEKKNTIDIDEKQLLLTKTVVSSTKAEIESIALATLNEIQKTHPSMFPVPSIGEKLPSNSGIVMSLVPGIKLNDFLGILNGIIEYHPNRRLVKKCHEIKQWILSSALRCVGFFQSDNIQALLSRALNPFETRYDYKGKFVESCKYIFSVCDYPETVLVEIMDDIYLICEGLGNSRLVYFRDSVFKNQILLADNFTERDVPFFSSRVSGGRFHGIKGLNRNMRKFYDFLLNLEKSTLTIYNIDFEQIAERVSVVDDWNQILTAEVVGLNYDEGLLYATRELGINEELYNFSVTFRSFRAWSRRLFYRHERPDLWLGRYSYETLSYHFLLAYHAVRLLKRNSLEPNYLSGLWKVLSDLKPSSKYWPWHILPRTYASE
jgi:hypothetical protein